MMQKLNLERNKKLLGFDIGTKRIGLAIWNPKNQLASPLPRLDRTQLKKDLEKIRSILLKEEIEALVVGVPYALSGKETESTRNAFFWAETLEKEFGLPVFQQDESLSSLEADRNLSNLSSSKRKMKIDSEAAAIILESFIHEQC